MIERYEQGLVDKGPTGLRLRHIDMEVNHRCNLLCRHCSARATDAACTKELSIEEVRATLRAAQDLGLEKVGLTGGEPLYDLPHLQAVARLCSSELGVSLHTHTNGTLLPEKFEAAMDTLRLFDAISVTFLGGTAVTHDHMTQVPGSFARALDGARQLVGGGFPLTCYFIPTHGTCHEFKQLALSLSEMGVTKIRAMALAPSGRARPVYGETAPLSEEREAFEQDLLALRDETTLTLEAGDLHPPQPSYPVSAGRA